MFTSPFRYDGGRPVTHYVIEQKGKFDVDYIEVLKTEDASLEAVVEGLKEKAVFQWRVRAVNKAGPSLPCEPTDKHIVKHRHSEFSSQNRPTTQVHIFALPTILNELFFFFSGIELHT